MAKKNKLNRGGPTALNQVIGGQGHNGQRAAGGRAQGSPLLNNLYESAKIPQESKEAKEAEAIRIEPVESLLPARLDESDADRRQLEAFAVTLRDQQKQLENERRTFDARSAELQARDTALTAKEAEFGQRETQQAERLESLSAKDATLTQRERDIELRELDARRGFTQQNQKALRDLKNDIAQLETRRAGIAAEIEQRLTQSQEQFLKESDATRSRLAERAERLATQEAVVTALEDELAARKLQMDSQKRTREEMESMLRKRLESEFETERAERDRAIDKLRQKNEVLSRELEGARDELDGYADLADVLGSRAPSDLLRDMEDLKHANSTLRRKVSELETHATLDEIGTVRDERDRALEELDRLRIEVEGYRQRAHTVKMAALERERAADELYVMQRKNQAMKMHLDELETRIGKLTDSRQSATTFPELARMDAEPEFQTERPVDKVRDLKAFTDELRIRLACVQPDNPLFFRTEDLQLFVGGLAMSQLHVFQGISGTGKTSLAKAFAKVVGGECQDIAVQAGWRDRSDLLGHYNTFERRFAEKECLQALYRAATPSARDRLNIVLLDEMNLSRPEQYFADFLSALEKEGDDRLIRLVETSPPNAPRELRGGREIALPENLWFIGTANQDETTNELADKTHDRAFVLELPRHEDRFELTQPLHPKAISFASLDKAFRNGAGFGAERDRRAPGHHQQKPSHQGACGPVRHRLGQSLRTAGAQIPARG
ncbi:AAA family ATPase [Cupriavidus basilensis]